MTSDQLRARAAQIREQAENEKDPVLAASARGMAEVLEASAQLREMADNASAAILPPDKL